MKAHSFTIHIEPVAEGGFWAQVPPLPGCFSQGETIEETIAHTKEAIGLYLKDVAEHDIPEESALSMSVRVPVSS